MFKFVAAWSLKGLTSSLHLENDVRIIFGDSSFTFAADGVIIRPLTHEKCFKYGAHAITHLSFNL